MDTNELLKRVHRIEIKTRALSNNIFAGEYHSAFKGRGMSFSEVREYQLGDDVRDIDWNVTARFNKPYIKVYEEERELTVMLLIDVSGSLSFGTQRQTQRDMLTEIAATLSFSAIQNNDKIGVIFFSDKIEKFIPPKKGRTHILGIIRTLLNFTPDNKETNIKESIEYLIRIQKRSCTAFIISDFIDTTPFQHQLMVASQRHDIVAIQIYDKFMANLPDVGLVRVQDAETEKEMYLDTSDIKLRQTYHKKWIENQAKLQTVFNKSRVDSVCISTDEDYVKALMNLFLKRI